MTFACRFVTNHRGQFSQSYTTCVLLYNFIFSLWFQLSQKTLHDLELIVGDSSAFGIHWRRVQNVAPAELLEEEEEEEEGETVAGTCPSLYSQENPQELLLLF